MKKYFPFFSLFAAIILGIVHPTAAQDWLLTGNSNATTSSKLGTTNNIPVRIFTSNLERIRIDGLGKVGIGTTAPNAAALFEVSSTTKGILIPRMSQAQRNAIAFPVTGLLIFQTDGIKGFYYYDSGWKPVAPSSSSFANTTLSNLGNTSINADLIPNTNNLRSLGAFAMSWKNLYIDGKVYMDALPFINAEGTENTFVGTEAGRSTSTTFGGSNTGLGYFSLYASTTSIGNTAVGSYSLFRNTTGATNTAVGASSLFNNTTGIHNTAVGYNSLLSNATGHTNVAVGVEALKANTTGNSNTAAGSRALTNNSTGNNNAAVGNLALYYNTEGFYNTATGVSASQDNTTGYNNTATGAYALFRNTSGHFNTAVGMQALSDINGGSFNSAIGLDAGSVPSTNFSYGTFVGARTGGLGEFTNITAVGYEAQATASNQVKLGNSSVTTIGGYVNWTNFSDARYKKDLKEDVPGIKFINELRPVTYTLDLEGIEKSRKMTTGKAQKGPSLSIDARQSSSGFEPSSEELTSKKLKAEVVYTGFIAQEVEKAAKKINYNFSGVDAPKNDKDFYGLRYAEFVVPLVKAVQELDSENKMLKEELAEHKEELEALKQAVMKLQNGHSNSNDLPNNNTSAYLEQNAPNPFGNTSVIRYYVPNNSSSVIVLTNIKGQVIKRMPLSHLGNGQITISSSVLAAGTYNYTLWVNGMQVETKQLIIAK